MTRAEPQRHAVVVGSATYDDPGLITYPTVANSADRLKQLFDASNLWHSCELVRDPESAAEMMLPIRAAARRCTQGDSLLVYYIGHAVNPLRIRHSDILLALRTTIPGEYWSFLSLYHVYDMVRRSRATSKILVLDCCYCGQAEALGSSGAEGIEGIEEIPADPAWLGDEANTCVLKAVGRNSANQKADPYFEQDPAHPYTAFSGYLISVLENGIEGVRNPLQVRDVYNELRRTVPASGAHPEPELLIRNEPWIVLMENRHPAAEVGPPAEPTQLARLRAATPEELAQAWRDGESVTLSGLPRALIDDYFADILPRADAETVLRVIHHLHTHTATGELDDLLPLLHKAAPDNAGAAVRRLHSRTCRACQAFAKQMDHTMVQALSGVSLHEYSRAASGG